MIGTATGPIRGVIASVTENAAAGDQQKFTLTFTSSLGKSLSWAANQPQWTRLVRQEAFIVVPKDGKNELRLYPSFENGADINDPESYTVITDQLGTEEGDEEPFFIENVNGARSLRANLRVKAAENARWLAGRQANDFNTVFHMDLALTSRLRPRNTQ